MRVFRDILVAAAVLVLGISVIEGSARAGIASVLFAGAAYGMHRRLLVVWWLGIAVLVWSGVDSILGFFRGPRTDIAIMCSLMATLLSALLVSVWFRQRSYFQSHATNKT